MSGFDPLDFQPNSVGVMVVRVIRLKDIVRTLGCTEEKAHEVVREIRGESSADGELAFVLPSQLARWAYQRAGEKLPAPPSKAMLVSNPADAADALRRAAAKAAADSKPSRKKLILSKREAAKLLGVGRNKTLHELIRRGLLKTVEVNGHVKVPRADVERIAREGFDLDAPQKLARRTQPTAKPVTSGLEAAIRRLKL